MVKHGHNGSGWTGFGWTPDGEHEYVSEDEYNEIRREEKEDKND